MVTGSDADTSSNEDVRRLLLVSGLLPLLHPRGAGGGAAGGGDRPGQAEAQQLQLQF